MRLLLCILAGLLTLEAMTQQHARFDGRIPEFLLVDLAGDGICLTGTDDGVDVTFIAGNGPKRTAWSCGGRDDAFLVLDNNGNGRIDGVREMLGGMLGPPNGFEYLRIRLNNPRRNQPRKEPSQLRLSAAHPILEKVALWTDKNHNGKSEEIELQSIAFAGIHEIDLAAVPRSSSDRWGNEITFESTATVTRNSESRRVRLVSVKLRAAP